MRCHRRLFSYVFIVPMFSQEIPQGPSPYVALGSFTPYIYIWSFPSPYVALARTERLVGRRLSGFSIRISRTHSAFAFISTGCIVQNALPLDLCSRRRCESLKAIEHAPRN